jgi:hypothetical protein
MAYKIFSGNDVAAAAVAVGTDSFLIMDNNDSDKTRKESIADLVAALAGNGLAASSGVLSVDNSELTGASVSAANDSIMFIDADDSSASKKESIADLMTAVAGTGLSASSGALSVDASQSQITTLAGLTAAGTAGADLALTYDTITVTDATGGEPVLTLKNTNDDATGSTLKFLVDTDDSAAAGDTLGTLSFDGEDAGEAATIYATITGGIVAPTAGSERGAIKFNVAEYDSTLTTGLEIVGLASDGNITVDVKTHDGSAGGLMLAGTLVTSTAAELNLLDGVSGLVQADLTKLAALDATAAELNLMDGGTSATGTTLATTDRVVVNDDGTMVQVAMSDFETFMESNLDTLNSVTSASSLATTGTITSGVWNAGAVTSSGALTGASLVVDDIAADGKVLTMTGSTDDTATFTVGANGTLAITTVDTAAAAANMTLTADGTFEAVGTTITLDSGGAINLEPAASSVILLDGTISVDGGVVTGATSITSTAFVGALTGDVTGTAAVATALTAVANNSADETVYPLFVDGATGTQGPETDTGFTYNPSSGLLTISGELDAGSLDISGNADIDGTMEADAYTVDGTALNEYIADTVGAMVGSNTESGITVAYVDGDNTLDFTVATLNQDTSGTAAIATTITVADESSDTTCFPLFATAVSGDLAPKSGTNLTFNSATGALFATGVSGYSLAATGVVAKTANYTVDSAGTPDSVILCDSNTGTSAFTVTLPAAAVGRMVTVKDSGGGSATYTVTIATPASQTIDGAASYVLEVNYGAVTLTNDGTNWFII